MAAALKERDPDAGTDPEAGARCPKKQKREEVAADDWGLAVTLEQLPLIGGRMRKGGQVDVNNVRIELVDILHFSLSGRGPPLSDTQNAITTFRHKHAFATITRLVAAADLNFNIISYYVAKHTLNNIRQLQGYKDGTYVKVNKGMEDNELLHQCIEGITVQDAIADFPAVAASIMSK
eukprot:gene20678-4727_t